MLHTCCLDFQKKFSETLKSFYYIFYIILIRYDHFFWSQILTSFLNPAQLCFTLRLFCSTCCTIIIWRALHYPVSGQPLKSFIYQLRDTLRKVSENFPKMKVRTRTYGIFFWTKYFMYILSILKFGIVCLFSQNVDKITIE